ncbi:MAG: RecQ family zinc-binding domain-containing protein, partial [Gemmatimonadaceae bacterium]
LRSLWRRVKDRLHQGIVADLDAVPPGLGGAQGAFAQLEALQARQMVVWRRLGEGTTLADPRAPIDAWGIDWAALERRHFAEMKKLEQMQRYAYTEQCRRAFVLRYFGDPAARPRCTGCDNCLGTRISSPSPDTPSRRRGRTSSGRRG